MAKLRFTDAELDLLMESAYLVESSGQDQKNKDESDKKAEEFVKKFIAAVNKSLPTQIKAIYLLPPKVIKKLSKSVKYEGVSEKDAEKYLTELLKQVDVKVKDKAIKDAVKKFLSLLKEKKTDAFKEARKVLCETTKAILKSAKVKEEIKTKVKEKLSNGTETEKEVTKYINVLFHNLDKIFNCEGKDCKEEQICPDDFDVVPVARLFDALFRAKEDAYKFSTGVRLSVKAAIAAAIIILIVGVVKRYKGYSFKEAVNPVKVAVGLKQYLTDPNTPWYGKLVIILAGVALIVVVSNVVITDLVPFIKEKFFDKEDKKEESDKQSKETEKKEGEGQ